MNDGPDCGCSLHILHSSFIIFPKGRDAMGRMNATLRAGTLAILSLFAGCVGCSSPPFEPPAATHGPVVRVRLLGAQDQVLVKAASPPLISSSSEPQPKPFNFPPDAPVQVVLLSDGSWRIGG